MSEGYALWRERCRVEYETDCGKTGNDLLTVALRAILPGRGDYKHLLEVSRWKGPRAVCERLLEPLPRELLINSAQRDRWICRLWIV